MFRSQALGRSPPLPTPHSRQGWRYIYTRILKTEILVSDVTQTTCLTSKVAIAAREEFKTWRAARSIPVAWLAAEPCPAVPAALAYTYPDADRVEYRLSKYCRFYPVTGAWRCRAWTWCYQFFNGSWKVWTGTVSDVMQCQIIPEQRAERSPKHS